MGLSVMAAVPQADLPDHLATSKAVPADDMPMGLNLSSANANTSPPPKEKPAFSGSFGNVVRNVPFRDPLKDIGATAYGLGTSTVGQLGDLGARIPGSVTGLPFSTPLPSTSQVRGALPKSLTPGPGEEAFVKAGEYAPLAVGGAALGKGAVNLTAKGVGKLAPLASDIAKGIKPRALLESIAKPSSISQVGETIQKKIEGTLQSLINKRRPEAEKLFNRYLSKGKQFEDKILSDYKRALEDYYAKGVASGKLSNEQITAIRKASDRLSGRSPELHEARVEPPKIDPNRKFPPKGKQTTPTPERVSPGIGALEKERRVWNDIANGYDVKGAEGITAQAAHDISNLLTNSIKKYAPKEFNAAMEGYQKLSEPINKFNTAIGKRVTAKADEFLPEISKTDPALIPRAFFKSRRSAQELKELAGDPKFAESAAKAHVANDLAGARTAAEVSDYVQKNADWLQEFPQLRKQLEDAAKTIGRGEGAKKVAGYGAAAAGLGAIGGVAGRHFLGGL